MSPNEGNNDFENLNESNPEIVHPSDITPEKIIIIDDNECEIDSVSVNDDVNVSIDLSSDEESETLEEVVLDVLKRPKPKEPKVPEIAAVFSLENEGLRNESIEVLDIDETDEEFPVCVSESAKNEGVNIVEKSGYIKEFIETEGLGILFSPSSGLVLFSISTVWVEGKQLSPSETRECMTVGTPVKFYDRVIHGEQYRRVSAECVLHQAVVVWLGARASHLMKRIDELGQAYIQELEKHVKVFMLYLRGEVFMRVSMVRVKGQILGYLNQNLGLLEVKDKEEKRRKVLFHLDSAVIFRSPAGHWRHVERSHLLPPGLRVSVDVRTLDEGQRVADVGHQAVVVLAGAWPDTPHPSLLPGGQGSYAPAYEQVETPEGEKSTFYYLELALEEKLNGKVRELRGEISRSGGKVRYVEPGRDSVCVRSNEDQEVWRSQFTGQRKREHSRERGHQYSKKLASYHTFKAPLPRRLKTKEELDTSSDQASVGSSRDSGWSEILDFRCKTESPSSYRSSCSASSVSSLSDRPSSCGSMRLSGQSRSWYSNDPGCLRIKKEIKRELSSTDGGC